MYVLVYYCPCSVMLDEHIFYSFDLICRFNDSLFYLRPTLDQLHYIVIHNHLLFILLFREKMAQKC